MSIKISDITKSVAVASKSSKKKAKYNFNYGSMEDVLSLMMQGSTVFVVNVNFKKGSTLMGDKPSMGFFGGALKRKNDMTNAFAEFMPTSYSLKDGKKNYISSGTSYALSFNKVPTSDEMAQLANYNAAAKQQFMQSRIVQVEQDYDAWQMLSTEKFGGPIKLQFNVPTWNAQFIEEMIENRDLDLTDSDLIRSMSIYFSFAEEDKASFDIQKSDILKANDGQVVVGTLVQPAVIACFFNTEIFKSARFEGSVSRQAISQTVADIAAMKAELNSLSSNQVSKELKVAKKTIDSFKTEFEAGLKEGKWFLSLETKMMDFASTSTFPGWSLLAAKVYFSKLSIQYDDVDYIDGELINDNNKKEVQAPTRRMNLA